MKHIVVEGVDGTGKTTLIKEFVKAYGLPVHPRSTPSVGGPPPELDRWVEQEFQRQKTPGVYDRHAIISEPIYGPVCRGKVPGKFNDPVWITMMRRRLSIESIVVFCIPPWTQVHRNIHDTKGDQMEGVVDNSYMLYQAYQRASKQWPGPVIIHDYTKNLPGTTRRNSMMNLIYLLSKGQGG